MSQRSRFECSRVSSLDSDVRGAPILVSGRARTARRMTKQVLPAQSECEFLRLTRLYSARPSQFVCSLHIRPDRAGTSPLKRFATHTTHH